METRQKLKPFILTICIIVVDQLSKAWITANIPRNTIGYRVFGGDFLRIIHVRNNAVAFSMGSGLPDIVRVILFIIIPILIIGYIVLFVIRSNDFSIYQRWLIAGAVGGGVGNLIDRVFRDGLVVDFIDVKFYGLFGLQRFPTFNAADSSIVVCGILLLVSFLFSMRGHNE